MTYDNLITLVSLEKRFFKALALLSGTNDILSDLGALEESTSSSGAALACSWVRNHRRQCDAFWRTATYLQNRARTTAQLLSDTLALQDQVIAKDQGANMLQLNKSAVFLTTLTLVYLPGSFVAVSACAFLSVVAQWLRCCPFVRC